MVQSPVSKLVVVKPIGIKERYFGDPATAGNDGSTSGTTWGRAFYFPMRLIYTRERATQSEKFIFTLNPLHPNPNWLIL
jgi:hypothetical protein